VRRLEGETVSKDKTKRGVSFSEVFHFGLSFFSAVLFFVFPSFHYLLRNVLPKINHFKKNSISCNRVEKKEILYIIIE